MGKNTIEGNSYHQLFGYQDSEQLEGNWWQNFQKSLKIYIFWEFIKLVLKLLTKVELRIYLDLWQRRCVRDSWSLLPCAHVALKYRLHRWLTTFWNRSSVFMEINVISQRFDRLWQSNSQNFCDRLLGSHHQKAVNTCSRAVCKDTRLWWWER